MLENLDIVAVICQKWFLVLSFEFFFRLHISALHKFTYGKHILAKLENYYANNQWGEQALQATKEEKSEVKFRLKKKNWI